MHDRLCQEGFATDIAQTAAGAVAQAHGRQPAPAQLRHSGAFTIDEQSPCEAFSDGVCRAGPNASRASRGGCQWAAISSTPMA